MVPIPEAVSLDDLNEKILRQCVAYGDHKIAGRDRKVSELYEDEKGRITAEPSRRSIQQCAYVRRSRRQVRHSHRRQESIFGAQPLCGFRVKVLLHVDRVEIFTGSQKLATHERTFGNNKWCLNPDHYLELIQQRPWLSTAPGPFGSGGRVGRSPCTFFLSVFAALKAKPKGSRTSSLFSCSTGIIRPARSKPRWRNIAKNNISTSEGVRYILIRAGDTDTTAAPLAAWFLRLQSRGNEIRIERDRIKKVERRTGNVFAVIKELLQQHRPAAMEGLPPFTAGAVGYCAYDIVRRLENIGEHASDDLDVPDCVLMFFDRVLAFDHLRHQIHIVASADVTEAATREALRVAYERAVKDIVRIEKELAAGWKPAHWRKAATKSKLAVRARTSRAKFLESVRRAKEYIAAGDIFQVVLSQRWDFEPGVAPLDLYRALRTVNPSPYMYFLRFAAGPKNSAGMHVLGSSPEMLVRAGGRKLEYRPIAGTHPRGRDEAEDAALEKKMLADEKERAEHVMLVDLGRNDLGRVSEYGSVKVRALMYVERYSHVMRFRTFVGSLCRKPLSKFQFRTGPTKFPTKVGDKVFRPRANRGRSRPRPSPRSMVVGTSAAATAASAAIDTAGGAVADAAGFTAAGGSGGKDGQLLREPDGPAMRALRPPPVARPDQEFAVAVALVAMKLVNRHA